MTTRDADRLPPHTEAGALAWYLNGSLPMAEQRTVAAHLATCDQCRAELAVLQTLRTNVRTALDSEPGPALRVRQRVLRDIQDAGMAADSRGVLARLAEWLRRPLVPRWAATAALLLIVVQAGVLVGTMSGRQQPATGITTRALTSAATRLTIRFQPMATEGQIRALLLSLGARLVGGPSADGAYVVELTGSDPGLIGQKLSALRTRQDLVLSIAIAPP
jgi:anti-sigma factor RsiW